MDRPTDRKALKARALAALDEARKELGSHVVRARVDLAPRTLFLHGLQKYKIWIGVAAAAGGFMAVRFFLPSRRNIDRNSKPAKNRSLLGLLMSGAWTLARSPILEFAKAQLQNYILNRVGLNKTPQQTESSP
jgi:hypothetical protein